MPLEVEAKSGWLSHEAVAIRPLREKNYSIIGSAPGSW